MANNVKLVRGKLGTLTQEFTNFFKKESDKSTVVGMCGGRSILPFLTPLENPDISDGFRFFFIDERLVPVDHADSNYKGLKEAFFDKVSSFAEVFPFYYFEGADKDKLLADYQETFEDEGGRFDVVILGSGEDGHVASLFPHQFEGFVAKEGFFYIDDSPKPPKDRVTVSPMMIQDSKKAVVLFMGEGKREALANFLDDSKTIFDCPAKLALDCKEVLVLTDILEEK